MFWKRSYTITAVHHSDIIICAAGETWTKEGKLPDQKEKRNSARWEETKRNMLFCLWLVNCLIIWGSSLNWELVLFTRGVCWGRGCCQQMNSPMFAALLTQKSIKDVLCSNGKHIFTYPYIMICPAFWWQDSNIHVYLVFSAFSWRPTSLLTSLKVDIINKNYIT